MALLLTLEVPKEGLLVQAGGPSSPLPKFADRLCDDPLNVELSDDTRVRGCCIHHDDIDRPREDNAAELVALVATQNRVYIVGSNRQ